MSEEMKNEKVQETMEDFAAELEASYKEYDEKRSQAYVADETPDAEKWQEVKQLQADHAVVNVKIKEIVKGGAVAYLDELRAFIPGVPAVLRVCGEIRGLGWQTHRGVYHHCRSGE